MKDETPFSEKIKSVTMGFGVKPGSGKSVSLYCPSCKKHHSYKHVATIEISREPAKPQASQTAFSA